MKIMTMTLYQNECTNKINLSRDPEEVVHASNVIELTSRSLVMRSQTLYLLSAWKWVWSGYIEWLFWHPQDYWGEGRGCWLSKPELFAHHWSFWSGDRFYLGLWGCQNRSLYADYFPSRQKVKGLDMWDYMLTWACWNVLSAQPSSRYIPQPHFKHPTSTLWLLTSITYVPHM